MKRLNDWLDGVVGSGILWAGERFLALFALALIVIAAILAAKALT